MNGRPVRRLQEALHAARLSGQPYVLVLLFWTSDMSPRCSIDGARSRS